MLLSNREHVPVDQVNFGQNPKWPAVWRVYSLRKKMGTEQSMGGMKFVIDVVEGSTWIL